MAHGRQGQRRGPVARRRPFSEDEERLPQRDERGEDDGDRAGHRPGDWSAGSSSHARRGAGRPGAGRRGPGRERCDAGEVQRRHLAQRQGPEEQGSGRRHPSPIVAGMPSGVAEEERGGARRRRRSGQPAARPRASRGGAGWFAAPPRAGMDGIQRGRRHGRGLDGKQRRHTPAPGSVRRGPPSSRASAERCPRNRSWSFRRLPVRGEQQAQALVAAMGADLDRRLAHPSSSPISRNEKPSNRCRTMAPRAGSAAAGPGLARPPRQPGSTVGSGSAMRSGMSSGAASSSRRCRPAGGRAPALIANGIEPGRNARAGLVLSPGPHDGEERSWSTSSADAGPTIRAQGAVQARCMPREELREGALLHPGRISPSTARRSPSTWRGYAREGWPGFTAEHPALAWGCAVEGPWSPSLRPGSLNPQALPGSGGCGDEEADRSAGAVAVDDGLRPDRGNKEAAAATDKAAADTQAATDKAAGDTKSATDKAARTPSRRRTRQRRTPRRPPTPQRRTPRRAASKGAQEGQEERQIRQRRR
mgnify:CR=1 FL=1